MKGREAKGLATHPPYPFPHTRAIKEGQLRGFRSLRRHRGARHGERGGGEEGGRALLHGPLGYKGGGRGWGGEGVNEDKGVGMTMGGKSEEVWKVGTL